MWTRICTVWPSPYCVVFPSHLCLLLSGSLLDLPCHLPHYTNSFSPAPSVAINGQILSCTCLGLVGSPPSLLTFILSLLAFPPLLSLFHFFHLSLLMAPYTCRNMHSYYMFSIFSFVSKFLNNSEANILGWVLSSNSRIVSPLQLAQKNIAPCCKLVQSITRVYHAKRSCFLDAWQRCYSSS